MRNLLVVLAMVGVWLMAKKFNEIDIVARTAWGEARGEGYVGMQAVINVIYNRASSPVVWWGDSPVDVALKDYQFSVWNENDPNRAQVLGVTKSDPEFRQALDLAKLAAFGQLEDVTGGADHYYNGALVEPSWASQMTYLGDIGNHKFYRSA